MFDLKTLTINQKVFKHQDTQTKLKIALFENNNRVSLDSNSDYQFKIKNTSGYLKSEKLTIEDNRLVLTTDKFKDLTPDAYSFEVWENEDSIYPSENYGYFKITKNVSEVDGETIPVITIEDFEKRFDEAIKNAKGDKGDTGPQGLPGPVGPQGPKGERGEVGPKGEKGDTGLQGEKGDKGDTGERGADGKDGINGTNGRDGIDGKNGQDGKSAYQIWLDLGNSGSEQDFIDSLKATGIAIKDSQRRFDSILDKVNYKYWNTFPILYLDGVPDKLLYYDADKSVKADGVSFRFPFFNNSGRIEKMKVQGASSVKFPKKNYNITFEHPTTLHDAWGARKKYTLKGNFNDSSQARNVVSARIWAGMRKSHLKDNLENVGVGSDILVDNSGNEILGVFDKQLALGKGYGTIDGYPIGLVINGKYHGIYNLNIPKDGWMANMKKGKREVIVSADYSTTNAEYFQALANMSSDNPAGVADFSIEYISGSDDSWVLSSLNQMIGAVLEHHETDEDYVKTIEPYLDIDSAIDYYIMNVITGDLDANGKNYLLETWDGKKWYFASYDKDSTFGNVYWQGNVLDAEDKNGFAWYANSHRMFSIIYNHMRDRFIQRWEYLRRGVLSDANLFKMFGDFIGRIPRIAFDEENYLWPQTPFSSVKDFSQIMWWITHHMAKLDKEIQDIK